MQVQIEHDKQAENPYGGGKRLYIKSYGCQMNVYDAQRMGELLAPHGYTVTDTPDGADMIILNTCHIREKAEEKVFSDLGRMRKQVNKDALIAVGGCVGQAEGEAIMSRAPYVNIVFGPQTYHRLPEFIEHAERGMGKYRRVVDTDFPELEKFDRLPAQTAKGPSAFVTVQEGCDKFCAFCVVPYTRGAEISRPAHHVEEEVRRLVDQGVVEIYLLGQNVNAYHGTNENGEEANLAKLIRRVAKIDGVERIRFTTSHPNEMDAELIDIFGTEEKLMPYLHLPVQSGSDRILAAMNRNHTAEEYMRIIERLKAVRPDLSLSGDFIVGFPGETEEDYMDTLALIAEAEYSQAYSFSYSKRPGTPGAGLETQVPEEVKKERLAGLQALLSDQQEAFNARFLGQTVDVLVEQSGRDGQVRGRSPHNVAVNMEGNERLIGHLIRVNIKEARPKSLIGAIELTNA